MVTDKIGHEPPTQGTREVDKGALTSRLALPPAEALTLLSEESPDLISRALSDIF